MSCSFYSIAFSSLLAIEMITALHIMFMSSYCQVSMDGNRNVKDFHNSQCCINFNYVRLSNFNFSE